MRRTLQAALLAAGCLSVAACGFAPMDLPDNSGMKPGPGLFTGKDGEFVIYGGPRARPASPEEPPS